LNETLGREELERLMLHATELSVATAVMQLQKKKKC